VAYTDYLTPPLAVADIVAALDRRRRTGEGQFLDISQLEAGLHFLATPLLDYAVNGRAPEKMGNADPCAAPHGIYRCQGEDRWCAIAVFTDAEWTRFCPAVDHPEWQCDRRFSTLASRKENEAELNRLVETWTSGHAAEEIMTRLQAAGVAAGVVQNARDIYEDPQLAHRGFFWKMEHHEMGPFTHLGEPALLSETPATPELPAPCLGEHTEMICKELLGMDDEEFVNHMINGAFGF
jgi:benzylsuccinate CoA-transferase BbsF subunit